MPSDCLTCGRCAARADRPGAAARLVASLARAAETAGRRWRERRRTRHLLDLDDHLLADIGLSRDEARRALRGDHPLRRPDWRKPATPAARFGPL